MHFQQGVLAILIVCLVHPGKGLPSKNQSEDEVDPYDSAGSDFFPREYKSLQTKLKFPADEDERQSREPKSLFQTSASENVDDIDERTAIDIILAATKSGTEFDLSDLGAETSSDLGKLTSDPKIRAQVAAGNEAQARSYIRDKVCDLGLMPCLGGEVISKKSDYGFGGGGFDGGLGGGFGGIPLNDIRLVQPVAIKPVGPPISAVPLETPFKPHAPVYGPPLAHSSYGKQLPLYGPPLAPKPAPVLPPYNPKPYGFGGDGGGGGLGGGGFGGFGGQGGSVLPAPGHGGFGNKPLIGPLYNSGGKIVEHIHHHIHHTPSTGHAGIGTYGVIGGAGGLGGSGYASGFDEYGAAQKPSISLATPGGTHLGTFPQKKNNDLEFRENRLDDCACVPINQCASYDIVQQGTTGREVVQGSGTPNSGLVGYNIDPRNRPSNYDTESNGTDTNYYGRQQREQESSAREPRTQRRKREEPLPTAESPQVEGQGRFITSLLRDATVQNLTKFAGYDFGDDPTQLVKMEGNRLRIFGRLLGFEPTVGVSFGLPGGYPQAGGGYPLNPLGTDPLVNPYNGGGISLGPISVNPLVSFQKTKDKDKTKVFKPLVNLHITPNPSLLYGIKGLFHQKKAAKAAKFGFGHHGGYGAPVPVPVPVPVPIQVPVLPLLHHEHQHYHHQYPVSSGYGWPSSYSYPTASAYAGGGHYSKGWTQSVSPGYSGYYPTSPYGATNAYGAATTGGYSDAYAQAYAGGGYTYANGQGYRTNIDSGPTYSSQISNIPSQFQRDAGSVNAAAQFGNGNRFGGGSSTFNAADGFNSGGGDGNTFGSAEAYNGGNGNIFVNAAAATANTPTKTNSVRETNTDEDSALIQELLADGEITQAELDELNLGSGGSNNQDGNEVRRGRTLFPVQEDPSPSRFRSGEIPRDENQFLERRVLPAGKVETRLPIHATGPDAPHSNGGRLTFGIANPEKPSSRITFPDDSKKRSRRQVSSADFARVLSQSVKAQAQRQLNLGGACPNGYVCCRKPIRPTINQQQQQTYPAKPNNNYVSNSLQPNFIPANIGQCGKRNARGITGRVTNPNPTNEGDTDYGEYPWQVAILKKDGYDNVYVCGGSIIDERHVVTAAHCLKGLQPNDLRVRMGEWDVNHETEFYPHVERDVAGFAMHPDFYAGNLFNDIAVMRLEGAVDFRQNPHVSPVCVPPTNTEFGGQRCLVTGWGKDGWGDKGKYQNVLKEVDVPVLRHFDCEQKLKRTRLGPDFVLHSGFLCAGGEEGKDACKGDGGGPLVCNVQGTFMLAGIVSWGVGCGHREVPGVYMKVSHYRDWLQETIKV